MIGDAAKAGRLAELLLERGVYVIGFSYPVVPQGQARIRVQLSAAHSTEDVHPCGGRLRRGPRGTGGLSGTGG